MGQSGSNFSHEDAQGVLAPVQTYARITHQLLFKQIYEDFSKTSSLLSNGKISPIPLTKAVHSFKARTTDQGYEIHMRDSIEDFIHQFPKSEKLHVNGVDVGPIEEPTTPLTLSREHYGNLQAFSVTLHVKGSKLSYGKHLSNTNSYYFNAKTLSFYIALEEGSELHKSQIKLGGDFIVSKKSILGEKTVTVMSNLQLDGLERHYLPKHRECIETVPASQFLQVILNRFGTIDNSKLAAFNGIFYSTEETVKMRATLYSMLWNKEMKQWQLGSPTVTIIGNALHMRLNGDRYTVTTVNVFLQRCTFLAVCTTSGQQVRASFSTTKNSEAPNLTLAIGKEFNENPRAPPSLPPLVIQPLKSFGPWESISLGAEAHVESFQNSDEPFSIPPFFKRHCKGRFTTKVQLVGNEITKQNSFFAAGIRESLNFLIMDRFCVSPDNEAFLYLKLKLPENPTELEFFVERVSHKSLFETIESTRAPPISTNFGSLILDQCTFLTKKKSHIEVPAEKLNKMREYNAAPVKSRVNFVTQIFEIEFGLVHQQSQTTGEIFPCLMTLNFERMTASIVEKEVLGIELEFDLASSEPNLPVLLWEANQCNNCFADIKFI